MIWNLLNILTLSKWPTWLRCRFNRLYIDAHDIYADFNGEKVTDRRALDTSYSNYSLPNKYFEHYKINNNDIRLTYCAAILLISLNFDLKNYDDPILIHAHVNPHLSAVLSLFFTLDKRHRCINVSQLLRNYLASYFDMSRTTLWAKLLIK